MYLYYSYTCKFGKTKPDINIRFIFKNNNLLYDVALYHHFYCSQFGEFLNITMKNFTEVSRIVSLI